MIMSRRSLAILLIGMVSVQFVLAQKPDRSAPPSVGPPPRFHLGEIQHRTLSNGLPVIVYEKHDLPLVQMSLVVKVGIVNEPEGKSGIASMTAAMMTEGAGGRSASDIADAADIIGAELTIGSGYHSLAVDLNVPVHHLDSALALFADVSLHPTFPEEELERKRAERLTLFDQWRDEPKTLVSFLLNRVLFGSHPYARPQVGTRESVAGFRLEDLIEFHERNFGPNTSTIVVVGDVTPQEILPILERLFGGWKQVQETPVQLPAVPQVKGRKVLLVDKPGAAQSEIRIGRIGASRGSMDHYDVVVMNTILGGSFSSRLNQNLRERHGYTYGASSWFEFRPDPGAFVVGAAVQTAVTDSALLEFMKELRSMNGGATEDEVARARNYVARSYPSEFQTIGAISESIQQAVVHNQPDTYFSSYIERIGAVTKAGVEQAATKYVDPDNAVVVIVGDRKEIESKVAALGLGTIDLVSVDDILGEHH